jgi:hypothetical protein
MEGSVLYPLNELKAWAPEAFERERAKYDGRENVLEKRIGILGCLWNDALHFSTVHPAEIVAALEASGFEPPRRRFYEIDARDLDPSRTVIFLNRRDDAGDTQWVPFDPALVPQLAELTETTYRYYRECAANGTRPLLYGYLPHVLYRGSLDTRAEGIRIIALA